MDAQLERIKQDLGTLEQAIGVTPEFDARHVWLNIGWGIAGTILMLIGLFPHAIQLPAPWGAVFVAAVFLVLPGGLPLLFARRRGNNHATIPVSRTSDMNSPWLGAILLALVIAFIVWFRQLMVSPHITAAVLFLLAGLWCLLMSWRRAWRSVLVAWAVSFFGLAFALPYLSNTHAVAAMGACMGFAGLSGAALLHLQLKAFATNE